MTKISWRANDSPRGYFLLLQSFAWVSCPSPSAGSLLFLYKQSFLLPRNVGQQTRLRVLILPPFFSRTFSEPLSLSGAFFSGSREPGIASRIFLSCDECAMNEWLRKEWT